MIKDQKGNPVIGMPYKLVDASGKEYRGVTNEQGETVCAGAFRSDEVKIFLGEHQEEG